MKTFDEFKDWFLVNYTDLDKVTGPMAADGRRITGANAEDISFTITLYRQEQLIKLAADDPVLAFHMEYLFNGTVNVKGKRRLWYNYENFEYAYKRYEFDHQPNVLLI